MKFNISSISLQTPTSFNSHIDYYSADLHKSLHSINYFRKTTASWFDLQMAAINSKMAKESIVGFRKVEEFRMVAVSPFITEQYQVV